MNAFIACCKQKKSYACPAKELYTSTLFHLQYTYAEYRADHIYILSAKYGLLLPEQIIEPYDFKLPINASLNKQWSILVYKSMIEKEIDFNETALFLCGKTYYKNLISYFSDILIPTKSLGIGEQLAFYKSEIKKLDEVFKQ